MSAPGPSTARDFSSKPNPRSRYQANYKKYGTPLPILLPTSPLHPDYKPNRDSSTSPGFLSWILPRIAPLSIVPECLGVYDEDTRSVWVERREDMDILFQRGFFGKGTLSRSEPTWRERRLDMLRGGESSAAEKIREKRRLERKQFKIDRAQAMLDAAKAAEAVIATGVTPSIQSTNTEEYDALKALDEDEEGDENGLASPALTTGSIVDVSTLTPQTFLVRPTRPDINRNRGRNAFKRKPKPKPKQQTQAGGVQEIGSGNSVPEAASTGAPAVPPTASNITQPVEVPDLEDEDGEEEGFDEEIIEEMEHLQLGLEEAWFLSAALGVLRIYNPKTESYLPVGSVLPLFISPTLNDPTPTCLLPDDPFLVSYVVYHHFRSLGWVVKPGIKFSCDWLLYRKGPVFSHAAFSVIMIPVYTSHEDRENSPYGHEDWYEERMSWKYINTVMRVNSLVQKTIILVYVTIPALDSFGSYFQLEDGSLDPRRNDMRGLLPRYSIREVSLTRFGPARRRD